MEKRNKQEILSGIEKIRMETPHSVYGDVIVAPNQTFRLTSMNAHFPTITLNSGSIFEIANERYANTPVRLEIGKLILKPNGPASLMRFFNLNGVELDGQDGEIGRRGNDAIRVSGDNITHSTKGGDGENGDNGKGYGTRGILYLTINEIEIVPNTPLTTAVFSIDGIGPNGGDGGNGGYGGQGGNGVPPVNGAHDCGMFDCWCTRQKRKGSKGADGGAGGYPGNGGNGGNGATIYFSGPEEVFKALKNVADLKEGQGGFGGSGGAGGAGGAGARASGGGGDHCGRNHPAQPAGNTGESRILLKGNNGRPGVAGSFQRISLLPDYNGIIDVMVKEVEEDKVVVC